MKNMQEFHKWLSSVDDASTLQQRRLALLTHLARTQLLNAASDLAWDIWNETADAAIS